MKRFITVLMSAMIALTMMPAMAFAADPEDTLTGTVEALSGEATINKTSAGVTQAIYQSPMTLEWVDKDPSAGRTEDGWWIGIKVTAPSGAVIDDANYTVGGSTKKFIDYRDGENYITLWGQVTEEFLNNARNNGGWLAFEWDFDWNGDDKVDQPIILFIKANKCTLLKDGNRVYPFVSCGGKNYKTLKEALNAVNDDETITLLDNVTLTEDDKDGTYGNRLAMNNGKTFTIDLNGKTLAGRLNLRHGNVTIKNGVITNSSQPLNVYGSTNESDKNYSVLTIAADVTVNATENVVCMMPASGTLSYGAVINIDGTVNATGSGNDAAVYVSGNIGNGGTANIEEMNKGNVINISGSINGGNNMALAMSGQSVVNLEETAIITGTTGVGVKRGLLNINPGATVIANGAKIDPVEANNNGAENTGAAVSVTTTYNNYGNIKVNLKGGNITSENNSSVYIGHSSNKPFINGADIDIKDGTFISAEGVPAVYVANPSEAVVKVSISGGVFSSNPKDFVAEGINTYHQHEGNYFVGSMPASTSGFNAWALQNGVYEETYVAPAEPETPDAPVIDNSGSGADATTNVDASASTVVKDDKAETSINLTTGNKIVENAKENNVSEVVIKAETEKGEATGSTVALPESTVQAFAAEDVQASVTIKTDNATVTLDKDAVKATAEQAGTDGEVKLVVETKEKNKNKVEIELKLVTSKGTVSDFKGGNVTVAVPVSEELAGKKIVCVYIDENGKYTKMEGELSKDRKSYIFKTGHFSTYAILEEAEADAIIAEQNKPSDIASAKVTGVVNKTYTGKSITQNPVVTVGESKIVKGTDYTVSYKNNVNAGVATLTIKGVGSYTGAITKTFKINPKGTSISKVTGQKKAVKVVWKKQLTKMKTSYVSGYQVQYSTSSKFTSGTSKYANAKFSKGRTTKTIKNLKSGKKYYVRVRTYKSVDGTKCYSSWSKVKSVKTK